MKQWYCWIDGQQYGPVHLDELRDWIRQGRLHPGDYVWAEGMAEWTGAGNVPELFPAGSRPPSPVPAQQHLPPMPLLQQPTGYPGKGLCIASLVLGILSLPCLCCYGLGCIPGLIGLILGVIGIVQARRAEAPTGIGKAGIILSAVGLILGLVVIVCVVIAAMRGKVPDFGDPQIYPM